MAFDPLHKWLGIPPNEQPPNHYRLLGLALFEEDADVIDAGADKQLAFLHDLTNGPHAAEAESLSNRVSSARICLCDPDKRAAYDATLEQSIEGSHSVSESAAEESSSSLEIDEPQFSAPTPNAAVQRTSPAHLGSPAASTVNASFGSVVSATPEKTFFAEGWMVKNGDGVTYGPYAYELILEAARRGTIQKTTEIQHPVATGNSWLEALSIPDIAELVPSSKQAVPVSAPAEAVSVSLKPSPVKIRTKKKKKSGKASWFGAVAPSVMPGVMLVALCFAIARSPALKQALANILGVSSPISEPGDVEGQSQEKPEVVERAVEADGPPRAVQRDDEAGFGPRPTPPKETVKSQTTPKVEPVEPPEQPSFPRATPPPQREQVQEEIRPDLTSPTDDLHFLSLDFKRSQSDPLENARVDDEFFVERVDGSPVTITLLPVSGQLRFGETTHLIFDESSGLGLALQLIRSGSSEVVRIRAKPTVNKQEFIHRTFMKKRNEVRAGIEIVSQKLTAGPRQRDILTRNANRRGTTLDNRRKFNLQVAELDRNMKTFWPQERDRLLSTFRAQQLFIDRADVLMKNAKLVICVRSKADSSSLSSNSTSPQQ